MGRIVNGPSLAIEFCLWNCGTRGEVMDLLQVHASGLGVCCMAGPMIARDEVCGVLNTPEPWRMLGAVVVGYPVLPLPEAKPRKALGKVVEWFCKPEPMC